MRADNAVARGRRNVGECLDEKNAFPRTAHQPNDDKRSRAHRIAWWRGYVMKAWIHAARLGGRLGAEAERRRLRTDDSGQAIHPRCYLTACNQKLDGKGFGMACQAIGRAEAGGRTALEVHQWRVVT